MQSTCPWHDHVAMTCRLQSSTSSDRVNTDKDIVQVFWSSSPHPVKCHERNLNDYAWRHWQPAQSITYRRHNELISTDTSDQPDSGEPAVTLAETLYKTTVQQVYATCDKCVHKCPHCIHWSRLHN